MNSRLKHSKSTLKLSNVLFLCIEKQHQNYQMFVSDTDPRELCQYFISSYISEDNLPFRLTKDVLQVDALTYRDNCR